MAVDAGASDSTARDCGDCGTAASAGQRFCGDCGHDLSTDETSCVTDTAERPVWAGRVTGNVVSTLPPPPPAPAGPAAVGPASTSPRPRRRLVLAGTAAVLAVLLVVGVVGVVGARLHASSQDGAVRDGFAGAQREFGSGSGTLQSAVTMDDVRAAGSSVAAAGDGLGKAAEVAAARGNDLGEAAHDVLLAEAAVIAAAEPLADLSTDDLGVWVAARAALTGAVAGLLEARDALADVDRESAARVPNLTGLVPSLETVVGGAVADSSSLTLGQLLDDLQAAGATVDLRQVATRATETAAGVRAAAEGFPADSDQAVRLVAFAMVYDALGGLSVIDADHLAAWSGVRSSLTATIGSVTTDETLRGSAQAATDAVDTLVDDARQSLRTWRSQHATALDGQQRDARELQTYRDAMNGQLSRYSTLRGDLATWTDRVRDPAAAVTYDEAYSVLAQAEVDRVAVRDALLALALPTDLAGVHNSLVGVIDGGIAAVRSGYRGLSDAEACETVCSYADTAGWQRFSAESKRITGDYDTAVRAWEAAARSSATGIQARTLPAKPTV